MRYVMTNQRQIQRPEERQREANIERGVQLGGWKIILVSFLYYKYWLLKYSKDLEAKSGGFLRNCPHLWHSSRGRSHKKCSKYFDWFSFQRTLFSKSLQRKNLKQIWLCSDTSYLSPLLSASLCESSSSLSFLSSFDHHNIKGGPLSRIDKCHWS